MDSTFSAQESNLGGDGPGGAVPPVRVRDVMTRVVATATPLSMLQEVAATMRDLNIGSLPVLECGQVVGMITDRDIAIRSVAEGHDVLADRAQDVMTPNVICCYEDQEVAEVAALMREKQIRRIVVMYRDGHLAGILSLSELRDKGEELQLPAASTPLRRSGQT
jgi:CBS domain-containing protein